MVNGPNKKAADKEWVAEDFVKNELLRDYDLAAMYNKKKKERKNYVLAHNDDTENFLELESSESLLGKLPAAKIAKLRKLAKLKKFFLGLVPDGIGLGTTVSIGPIHQATKCVKHSIKKFLINLFTSVRVGECTELCESSNDCNRGGACAALPPFLLFGDDQKRCLNCKSSGKVCQMDSDCESGVCDGGLLYGLFKGKCFTPQKAGEKCDADEQCISGDCDGHAFGLFWKM